MTEMSLFTVRMPRSLRRQLDELAIARNNEEHTLKYGAGTIVVEILQQHVAQVPDRYTQTPATHTLREGSQ